MTGPIDLSGPLVDVDWLSNHVDHESVRIVDASFYLPHLNTSFDKEFAAARIPGARPFNIDLISSAESELPHMLPEAAAFGRAVGALGISNEHTIIAYDTLGMFSVARAWWMFRVFGHDAVAVLDGGLPAWRAA
ncbi:MAG: rhodanese-like domain-containing protein, partial [Pseudomonadota bacterium]